MILHAHQIKSACFHTNFLNVFYCFIYIFTFQTDQVMNEYSLENKTILQHHHVVEITTDFLTFFNAVNCLHGYFDSLFCMHWEL